MSASRDSLGTMAGGSDRVSPLPLESAALEHAGDGLLVVEATKPAAAIVYSNAAFTALCGYTAGEILGRDPFFVFVPAEHGDLERLLHAALASAAPQRAVAAARSKSGASQWLSVVMRALAAPGPAGHVVITIVDVTCQQDAHHRLSDSEHRFCTLMANAEDLVTVIDASARITFVAGNFLAAFGVRPEERLGHSAFEFVHPDDLAMVAPRLTALGATPGARDTLEFRIRRPDGTVRWFNSIGVNLLHDPQVRGIVVNSHDVTERRTAEEALERARAHLDIAVRGARIALWENDVPTDVNTWLNDEWYHILGVDPALGRATVDHGCDGLHPDDLEPYRQARQAHFDGLSGEFQVSFRMRVPGGGYKWLLDRGRVTSRTADGRALKMSGMTLDIDALKRAEFALRESQSRLEVALWGTEIGLWDWNIAADELAWINDWCEQWNLDAFDGVGHERLWTARVHADDLPAYQAKLASHLASETRRFDVEYRIRDRHDHWVWIQQRGRVIERDATGHALRMVGLCLNVDERRRAAQALERSESRFDLAVWGTQVGFWDIDIVNDEIHWWNDWCASVDLDSCNGPVHSPRWNALIHPDDVPFTMSYEALLQGSAEIYEAEYRMRTRSGGWRWIQSRGRVTARDGAGRALKVAGVTIDIDARKRAELALQKSDSILRSVTYNVPDWLLLVDLDLCCRFANREFLGRTPIEFVGQSVLELVPLSDRDRLANVLNHAIRASGSVSCELRIPTNADPRDFEIRAAPVIEQAAVVGLTVTMTEITQRKVAEALLRTQATILQTMREGVAVIGGDARVRLTNPAFDRMFGYEPGAVLGMTIATLTGGREPVGDLLARVDRPPLDEQQRLTRNMVFHRRDGTSFTGEAVIISIALGAERVWLTVVQDITERKKLEQEIIEISNREQHRIGRDLHDGLGQELAGVALMLRSLATKIHSSQPEFTPGVDEIVGLVNHAIDNARSLARGLSPVTLDGGGLVFALRAFVKRARETYGIDVRLQSRVGPQLTLAATTADHLYRIVQEAVNNAVRHGRAQRVRVILTAAHPNVRLMITDDGCGLPAGEAPASGMGLKIMAYRARMINGEVTVERRPRGGTRVLCTCHQPQGETAGQVFSG